MHSETKCKNLLVFGGLLSILGLFVLYEFNYNKIFSWGIVVTGKVLMAFGIVSYMKYRKLLSGEIQ